MGKVNSNQLKIIQTQKAKYSELKKQYEGLVIAWKNVAGLAQVMCMALVEQNPEHPFLDPENGVISQVQLDATMKSIGEKKLLDIYDNINKFLDEKEALLEESKKADEKLAAE